MRIDLPQCNLKNCRKCFDGNCTDKVEYERCEFAHYKDLAEQGRLLELPCKVGDTLYQIDKDRTRCSVHNEKFDESCCQDCEEWEEWECDSKVIYFIHEITPGKIAFIIDFIAPRLGTEIFLTQSEAEQALAERQG